MPVNAKDHYNRVTDAWKVFMGDNLHFGYFETEDMELPEATDLLIEKMLEFCDISPESRILDVGCGIGSPALYIHEKFGCAIDGISTSERGVHLAAAAARERGYDRVRFKVADGLDNGFPDETFDIVWIMEASHLIYDKRRLFRECRRVLEPGGTLVLCDITQLELLPIHRGLWRFFRHINEYYTLYKTFGPAQVLSLGTYCDRLVEAGFDRVTALDISAKALPTMTRWKENALRYLENQGDSLPRKYVDLFIRGCAIDERYMQQGHFGYGIVKAVK